MKARRRQRFKDGSQIVELANGSLMVVERATSARQQPSALQQTSISYNDPPPAPPPLPRH